MSALSDFRRNPIDGSISWRTMDPETHTAAEFDNLPGLFGFSLKDRPHQGFITITEDVTGGEEWEQVNVAPNPGQVYISFSTSQGYCIFHEDDEGKTFVTNAYQGGGSVANKENIGTLASFAGHTTDDLDEGIVNKYYPASAATKLALVPDGTTYYQGEFGLALSNNAGKVLNVAAGACWDVTRSIRIILGAFTGSLAGTFTAGTGNNKLDTGSVANNTTYHIFSIMKADGTADILFSTSPTSPTMPSGYIYKRRIGSLYTDGSGNWITFNQFGDEYVLNTPPLDVNSTNPGTSAVTRTLSVPIGIIVHADVFACFVEGTADSSFILSALSQADIAPITQSSGGPAFYDAVGTGAGVGEVATRKRILTNTSGQIRSRNQTTGHGEHIFIYTNGWKDSGITGLGA